MQDELAVKDANLLLKSSRISTSLKMMKITKTHFNEIASWPFWSVKSARLWNWMGTARALATDASASAAETEETMRVKENISRT